MHARVFRHGSSSTPFRRARALVLLAIAAIAFSGLPTVPGHAVVPAAAPTASPSPTARPAQTTFQVTSVVVGSGPSTPGSPCPAANRSAVAGSSRTIVVCGRNRATVDLTPVSAHSSLSGSFIGTVGTFSSGPIAGNSGIVVLGQWNNTRIVDTPGTSYRITTRIGSAANNTSPLRTFTGYVAMPDGPPVAENDAYSTDEDTPLVRSAAQGLLANDHDPGSDPLQVSNNTQPAHGSVTVAPDGSFTYTPDPDHHGPDSFTYTANDGTADSNTATVSLTVLAVNDPPVANADSYQVNEDTELSVAAPGVLANDTDPEGDPLTAVLVNDVTHGELTLNADGSFAYTPDADYDAPDGFTYKANDGNADSPDATVGVTINAVSDPPVADDVSDSTPEDIADAITLSGDDVDGDSLTFEIIDGPTHGSLGAIDSPVCGAACTTHVTYTPDADYSGPDTFTYRVSDGDTWADPATVSLTILPVNDAPSFVAGPDQQAVAGSGAVTVAGWATAISKGPANESGQELDFTVTASDPTLFTVQPAISDTGTLTYTVGSTVGTTTVDVTLHDDGGTANGGDNTSPQQSFTITVLPSNTRPTADATSGSGDEDGGAVTITLTGHDADGDDLTFTVGTANHGLVTVPGPVSCDGLTPQTCTATVTYTPNANFNGADSFTYTANDGTVDSPAATASVTIDAVNDAPSFTHDGDQTVLEDAGAQTINGFVNVKSAGPANESGQAVTVSVTGTDNDSLFAVPPTIDGSGTLSFTPAPDANGTATVSAQAVDDGGTANGGDDTGVETFDITITAVNDEPSFTKGPDRTLNEDAGAQTINPWATAISKGPGDESGQTLSFTVVNDNNGLFSAQPSVSPTGTLTFTTAPNKYGAATVSVSLTDNGGTANGGDDTSGVQTFTITVNAVNDPPVAEAKSFTAQANMKISLGGLLTGATDPGDVAGDPSWTPSFTLGSISVGAGCVGCTISNVNNAAGTFDFDPPAGGTGTYTFTYTVVDDGSPGPGRTSATTQITVTVNGPVIWFVNPSASPGGTGRLSAPFNSLAGATSAMGTNTNQRIFVEDGNVTGNVTLQNDGWLLSDAVTGASFDAVMGVTPPAGTISRPGINSGTQRTLTGTVTLGNDSRVRGFDLTPTATNTGLVASGKTGITVNQMSITTTSARAVDLADSSGTFSLTRVTATGADRGISLVNTNMNAGSFTVTGSGTSGSGGVISDSTALGTNAAPEGGIYLNNTKNVQLDRMTISSNDANGIYGNTVTSFFLSNSTLPNNGTDALLGHSGIRLSNVHGTSSITGVTVSGSRQHAAWIGNSSGNAAITVSNSTFRDSTTATFADGLLMESTGSAAVNFTSSNNTFSNNQTRGLEVSARSSQRMDVNVSGGTYTGNNNGLGLFSFGSLAFSVTGGTVTGCATCDSPVVVYKTPNAAGPNGLVGTVTGMNITNGNSTLGPGISVVGGGSTGGMRVAVTNNDISEVGQRGIYATLGGSAGSGITADLTISGNTITQVAAGGQSGIDIQAGFVSGDTVNLCAHVAGNTIVNPVAPDIRVGNNLPTTLFRLPGYAGAASDTTAVQNFLLAQNTAVDATATIGAGAPGFGGGAACAAP